MFGSVTVNGWPFLICSTNNGMTEPREAITLPYRVPQIRVRSGDTVRALATNTFSIMAFEMPIALMGYAALSIERQTTFLTPASMASAAEQLAANVHIRDGVAEEAFVQMRRARDATLDVPNLLIPAVQVNIRAGRLPPPDADGVSYLRVPLNVIGRPL